MLLITLILFALPSASQLFIYVRIVYLTASISRLTLLEKLTNFFIYDLSTLFNNFSNKLSSLEFSIAVNVDTALKTSFNLGYIINIISN